ncbi:hypoxanthine phosphoribosyltransferase [Thioclava sp. GXIMD4216]|uniref:Hypoxanthine phosphoribosyltransferase n=1 Tax=Thioclava litoralis TaxID=3076557 RepID=A0ABZ1DYL8_9RHOB|nr:hypoxanthine phosphoribosyltransferase [Thioclava sp. FTW29]
MTDRPYEIETFISAKQIAARVETLAAEITEHFAGTDKLVVIGLLRGSFVFIADLIREIHLPCEVDFLEASSYGNETTSSREVRILKDLRGNIGGRDVLVVEDIVDTGHTISKIMEMLRARGPRKIACCAMLDKPSRREVDVKADWCGFSIPDEFVIGYGLDFAQSHRNLPYIGTVKFLDDKK